MTNDQAADRSAARPRFRLTTAQWTNVAFVFCACVGALFSALYLIKGGDLIKEVAAWPRELFNGRPASIAQVRSAAQTFPIESAGLTNQFAPSKEDSGDPFSPASKLLNPPPQLFSRPNGTSSNAPFSSASSALNQLNVPPAGGDGLSRALAQPGVSDVPTTPATPTSSSTASALSVPRIAQNADHQGRIASARPRLSNPRLATSSRAVSARNTRSSQPRTSRQASRTARPSFFKSLFGFKTPRKATAHNITPRAQTRLTAAKTARVFKSTNRRVFATVKSTSSSAMVTNARKIQTAAKITRANTPTRSAQKTISPPISSHASSSLRSAPSTMGQSAALRSMNMGHGFGGTGGIGMGADPGRSIGRPGGR